MPLAILPFCAKQSHLGRLIHLCRCIVFQFDVLRCRSLSVMVHHCIRCAEPQHGGTTWLKAVGFPPSLIATFTCRR
jgi:hypothetical protein